MSCKATIRKAFIAKRQSLPLLRREEAKRGALKTLLAKLRGKGAVLSFASKAEEIDLWPLNQFLAQEGRLLLPRLVYPTEIVPYAVADLDHLVLHPTWNVLEPDPTLCKACPLEEIGVVLVPGVAFDTQFNRLGYGKGYYDRFLAKLSCALFGTGFKEQLRKELLEIEKHDVPLDELFLF